MREGSRAGKRQGEGREQSGTKGGRFCFKMLPFNEIRGNANSRETIPPFCNFFIWDVEEVSSKIVCIIQYGDIVLCLS